MTMKTVTHPTENNIENNQPKTVLVNFFECNRFGGKLFSVNPSTPANDALNMASLLLDSVIGLLDNHTPDEERNHVTEAAISLAVMAKAAIDSVDISIQGT